MDPRALYATLEGTFNPDAGIRTAAEQQLKLAESQPGYTAAVYQVVSAGEVDVNIRQAAAIRLKNRLKVCDWNNAEAGISEAERAMIKSTLIASLIASPSKVRSVLLEILKMLVKFDFPEKWPTLVQEVMSHLQGNNLEAICGSLGALRVIARRYEFSTTDDRKPLSQLAASTFPLLTQLFGYINGLPSISPAVAELQKLLCKIFWSVGNLDMPDLLISDLAHFSVWMDCFLFVLNYPVTVEDPSSPLWKTKKWVGHIAYRMLQKYGDLKCVMKRERKLGAFFSQNYAGRFLEAWMHLCNRHRGNNPPASHQVLTLAINYIDSSLDYQPLYAAIYTNIDAILGDIMFPLVCFNASDAELWQDNPHEYVRKQSDLFGDMYNPRYSVANFIMRITNPTKPFHKADLMPRLLMFLNRLLQAPDTTPQAKDGCLSLIGTLRRRLRDKPEYKGMIEGLLVAHVFPDFKNPNGFLRARAIWVASKFARIEWKDQQNFGHAIHATITLMGDPELPVRVQAGSCLRSFIRTKQCTDVVRPLLEPLVQHLFSLMAEIDSDAVIETLELIIEKFGENLGHAALQLCHKLASHFIAKSPNSPTIEIPESGEIPEDFPELGDEEEEQAMAAQAILRALSTLLEACHEHTELYPQMEPVLVPLMRVLLSKEKDEYLDEGLDILARLTYFPEKLSPEIWSLFPLLIKAYFEFAQDYFPQMLAPLDNYVSKDPATFSTGCGPDGKRYIVMVYEMMQKCLSDENSALDWSTCPKLMDSILQRCKDYGPAVNDFVPMFFDLVLGVISRRPDISNSFRTLSLNVIACGLYYNAELTIAYLEQRKVLSMVFSMWLDAIPKYNRWYDKKVTALGLTCILSTIAAKGTAWLPSSYFNPDRLKQFTAVIVKLVLQCHEDSLKADELDKEDEESDDEDDEDSDDDDDFDEDDGDDDDIDDDAEDDDDEEEEVVFESSKKSKSKSSGGNAMGFQFEAPESAKGELQKLLKDARGNINFTSGGFGGGGFEDGDDDDDDEDLDDDVYEAAIDDVEEAVVLRDTMRQLAQTNAELYGHLMAGLTHDTSEKLEKAVKYGEEQLVKAQQEKEKENAKKAARLSGGGVGSGAVGM